MDVHLLDGTYELFRHFFAVPARRNAAGEEIAAVRGVVGSVVLMLEGGATHIGVATDHVIESFRNNLWPDYKRGDGVDPVLLAQFPLLEEALPAFGVTVWPMVEYEADDALASAAALAAADPRVQQVYICSPDKDLGQCVIGNHVVQLDRRTGTVLDAAGVAARHGVPPVSIPDYLALTGDSADGFPGLPGWGAKSSAAILMRYGHIEAIPDDVAAWDVPLRGAARLAETLRTHRALALLFRDLATLRNGIPLFGDVEVLRWQGPTSALDALAMRIEARHLAERVRRLTARASES